MSKNIGYGGKNLNERSGEHNIRFDIALEHLSEASSLVRSHVKSDALFCNDYLHQIMSCGVAEVTPLDRRGNPDSTEAKTRHSVAQDGKQYLETNKVRMLCISL